MAYRTDAFVPGEYYHVYNRGNSKQDICRDETDFRRMQALLFLCNGHQAVSAKDAFARKAGPYSSDRGEPLVAIGAYCVLRNHFHILCTPLVEGGVSQFMSKFGTAYVMYFNRRYDRTGSLFEGNFKAKLVESDRYLKYLYSYIHLNPVAKSPSMDLGDAERYLYSSLCDYAEVPRDEGLILHPEKFPEYFAGTNQWRTELTDWLRYDELENI